MNYYVISSKEFKKQFDKLDEKSKKIIYEKVQLVKANPFRYKKIHSKLFSRVFRIRFSITRKETRLIYVLLHQKIILICLLNRKNDYKNLEKYLKKIK
ncbi:MAG: hypothetical protein PVJ67_02055 [Candidatus Pacearchaeota archaeon]|jgi:mRNA-degrading endonuclease RelE of RelBE toxin-antitoxin system